MLHDTSPWWFHACTCGLQSCLSHWRSFASCLCLVCLCGMCKTLRPSCESHMWSWSHPCGVSHSSVMSANGVLMGMAPCFQEAGSERTTVRHSYLFCCFLEVRWGTEGYRFSGSDIGDNLLIPEEALTKIIDTKSDLLNCRNLYFDAFVPAGVLFHGMRTCIVLIEYVSCLHMLNDCILDKDLACHSE